MKGSVNDYGTPKITYHEFLKELKTVSVAIGINPALFATHSLRRGSVNTRVGGDQILLRRILIMKFFLDFNFKLFNHQN